MIILQADLDNPTHQHAVVDLVNAYAREPMGLGRDLPENVRRDLVPGLRRHPTTLVFLAFDGGDPVGVAVCFLGFSTFAARPLINVHDLAVVPTHRGRGVGRRLLEEVEAKARTLGCCKITLEVKEDNTRAQRLYQKMGFKGINPNGGTGGVWFLQKRL